MRGVGGRRSRRTPALRHTVVIATFVRSFEPQPQPSCAPARCWPWLWPCSRQAPPRPSGEPGPSRKLCKFPARRSEFKSPLSAIPAAAAAARACRPPLHQPTLRTCPFLHARPACPAQRPLPRAALQGPDRGLRLVRQLLRVRPLHRRPQGARGRPLRLDGAAVPRRRRQLPEVQRRRPAPVHGVRARLLARGWPLHP